MKVIAGKIAMILILVMIANSFTGCFTVVARLGNMGDGLFDEPLWVSILLDIASLVVLGILGVTIISTTPNETRIYLTGVVDNHSTNYISAMEILNSLPEEERVALMGKLDSLSETEKADLIKAFNSLPASEVTASIKRLNNLYKTELISGVRAFNSLSEAELNILTDKLNERAKFLPKTEYTDIVALSHQKSSAVLCFQY
jgi:hypothetical protein